jgi:nicotinate-nucleotide adenylyltransferase
MPLVGILGGTFDPIHYAHLRLAQEIVDNLRLTQVKFVLAARPPHRDNPQTSARHRAEMVRLAIADNPLFALDTRELDRSGPSYSFDTLTSLRAELGAETPLCLIVGADAFLGLPTWHRWRELFELAHVVVAHRPGFTLGSSSPAMPAELWEEWQQRYCADAQIIKTSPHGSILTQETTALDISASAIRELVSRGGNPRYLLPEAVLTYILEHQLYAKDRHES